MGLQLCRLEARSSAINTIEQISRESQASKKCSNVNSREFDMFSLVNDAELEGYRDKLPRSSCCFEQRQLSS